MLHSSIAEQNKIQYCNFNDFSMHLLGLQLYVTLTEYQKTDPRLPTDVLLGPCNVRTTTLWVVLHFILVHNVTTASYSDQPAMICTQILCFSFVSQAEAAAQWCRQSTDSKLADQHQKTMRVTGCVRNGTGLK